ncbi:unnamed protein product [Aureobasidium uvarum]|uniref:Uncharacterized protein n=1 Tax=Aureobasidium uvarum TaxID=2773716 RepID=A0A9N8KR12_9PEZI|nr:unnamed protein product [Aureobasidium uvarum]
MSQDKLPQMDDSWSDGQNNSDLHLRPPICDCDRKRVIDPMRFKFILEVSDLSEAPEATPLPHDVHWLPSKHSVLIEKALTNLYRRLNRRYPGRPHWYLPWRKRHYLNVGLELFITYRVPFRDLYPYSTINGPRYIYNTIEVDEASWPNLIPMLRSRESVQAKFSVHWWIEGERMVDDVECWKDAGS